MRSASERPVDHRVLDDATLAHLASSGDRAAFGSIYDRYADSLFGFAVSVVRDRDEAADVVQDVFVVAATRWGQLRDPGKLRPWLYAITRHESLRRVRRREQPTDDLPEPFTPESEDPAALASTAELTRLVQAACEGLADRDRAVLDLHLRHGLSGGDLGDALGVSAAHANVMFARARDSLDRAVGALVLARHGAGGCSELAGLVAGWNGRLTPLMRKRLARHADRCRVCGEQRRRRVHPAALLTSIPILTAPWWLRDRTADSVELVANAQPLTSGTDGEWWPPPVRDEPSAARWIRERPGVVRTLLVVSVLAALVIAAWVLTRPAVAGTSAPPPPGTAVNELRPGAETSAPGSLPSFPTTATPPTAAAPIVPTTEPPPGGVVPPGREVPPGSGPGDTPGGNGDNGDGGGGQGGGGDDVGDNGEQQGGNDEADGDSDSDSDNGNAEEGDDGGGDEEFQEG